MSGAKLRVVEAFLGAFVKGDLDTALALFDASTIVEQAGGMPFSGTYVGPDGFRQVLRTSSKQYRMAVESTECVEAGEHVLVRIALKLTARVGGASLRTRVV